MHTTGYFCWESERILAGSREWFRFPKVKGSEEVP